MSIMSWNCRELGNPWAVQALKRAITRENPNLVFLKETKLKVDEMKRVQHEIGMVQGIAVPSVGRSGGLGLLWKSNLKVLVKFINRWYIDALIDSGSEVGIWRLTGFYENPETHKRIDSWEVLTRLGQRLNKPWVCIGDFNEVLSVNEKEGRAEISSRQIMNFRQCLDSNGLRDLGFTGSWFTWAVDRRDYGCIQARLDRAMATTEWSGIFPWGRLYHRANSASDHSWETGIHMGRENTLEHCLEHCRTLLSNWNSQVFGHVGKNIERIQGKLQSLEA
ncbi:uncharacterized protein LOC112019538 [Quercus suber]|uniref:uncharacterized protein LOC112019538 n=1 Tax=Quercus suber TaxID=58331 RepID=UPI000CE206ED|nr:uncharacterized protein LOC112019538 [Quercus suber]